MQIDRHVRGNRAAARRRIEREADFATHGVAFQQRGRRRNGAVDTEGRARRRRLRVGIRHLEQAAGDGELAAGRNFDRAAPEIDGGAGAGDVNVEIGVADRRQVSTGRKVEPLVSISTDSPSSGVGGPPFLKSTSGALPAITTRSTMPPVMWLVTHSRTSAAANTGHSRCISSIGMRVPATPKAKCGSPGTIQTAGDARRRHCATDGYRRG